jgi:glycosyltransferase involved in cell wall biosynthesis
VVRRAGRGADLVLVNGLLALPALRLARLDSPAAWLVHDVVVRRDLELVTRFGAPSVRRALAVSDAAGALARRLGIDVTVVRNGTRWPVDPADPEPPTPPIVGINAMVTPWKGHAVVFEAMANVPGAVLEVLGGTFPKDAGHLATLVARAAQPDLSGRVRFLGHQADPLEHMRRWTVAVNASTDPEAAPLSVLEAMSLGLPVVATDHGGTPEVLGGAGLLVPPGDPGALGSAVAALLDDPFARARCRAAGRAAVAAGLDLASTGRHFLDALAAVAR